VTDIYFTVKQTTRFKKDLRRIEKQGLDITAIKTVVRMLANGDSLDSSYRDHALTGEYRGCRECHIRPDWLLVYEIDSNNLYLYLIRTGSHSELFTK
jgi:mRNA interferase YafQ